MRSNNPVFSRSPEFSGQGGYATFRTPPTMSTYDLQTRYDAPAATARETGRMTVDDVVVKTGILFVTLLATAAATWKLVEAPGLRALPLVAMLVGAVLGLVISFRQSTNPGLILTYAAVEGVFVGGISRFLQGYVDLEGGGGNIVAQAIGGTLAAFAAMLFLYKSGRLRATPKFTKMLMVAGLGYLVVGLVSLVASLFGVGGGFGFYGAGPLGLLLCAAGVALAAFFLIMDFDFVDNAVRAGAPARTAWLAGFGLLVTLVWLYVELLRLLAILRSND